MESVWPACVSPRLNPQYRGKRKNCETQNVNHPEGEKPCLDACCFHHQNRKLGYFHLARKNVCKLSVHSFCPLMDWCLDVFLSKDVCTFLVCTLNLSEFNFILIFFLKLSSSLWVLAFKFSKYALKPQAFPTLTLFRVSCCC